MEAQYGYCSGSEITSDQHYDSDEECLNECKKHAGATGCSYNISKKTCAYFTEKVTFAAGLDGVVSDPSSSRNICWIFKKGKFYNQSCTLIYFSFRFDTIWYNCNNYRKYLLLFLGFSNEKL